MSSLKIETLTRALQAFFPPLYAFFFNLSQILGVGEMPLFTWILICPQNIYLVKQHKSDDQQLDYQDLALFPFKSSPQ